MAIPVFATKNAVYRFFIFGLALAEFYGFSYTDMARSLYDFTHRTTTMHSARPKIEIPIYRVFELLTFRISPLRMQ